MVRSSGVHRRGADQDERAAEGQEREDRLRDPEGVVGNFERYGHRGIPLFDLCILRYAEGNGQEIKLRPM